MHCNDGLQVFGREILLKNGLLDTLKKVKRYPGVPVSSKIARKVEKAYRTLFRAYILAGLAGFNPVDFMGDPVESCSLSLGVVYV